MRACRVSVSVSDVDQNTVRQLGGIEVERTFADHAAGRDTRRPQLDQLLAFVRDGETVLVWTLTVI